MGLIQGAIGLPDLDNSYISTVGQRIVYDATQGLLDQWNADLNSATALFVEGKTTDFKQRYRLPAAAGCNGVRSRPPRRR
jgi:hypothetical protein